MNHRLNFKKASRKKCHLAPEETPVCTMSFQSKLEELLKGTVRKEPLLVEIYKDISLIKDPETLISPQNLSAFAFCYRQQNKLPDECWLWCENKVTEFIYTTKFSPFFKFGYNQSLILTNFPSPKIINALFPR